MSEETAFWFACAFILIGFLGDAYYRIKKILIDMFDEGEEE